MRLAFGEEADLDLYVTDPAQETVYFANAVSAASGGALEADLRCDAPAPRVEAVRFAPAPPGRYRVGVDHPARCGSRRGPVPFVVVAEFGAQRLERRGEVALGQFLPVVLEFEVPDRAEQRRPSKTGPAGLFSHPERVPKRRRPGP